MRKRNSKGISQAHKNGRCDSTQLAKGRDWSKGKTRKDDSRIHSTRTLTYEECFCVNSKVQRRALRIRLIDDGIIPYECSECGCKDVWNGKPITLQLEHKNGIENDNRLENLTFLCPNCHSQTKTWGGRNVASHHRGGREKKVTDEQMFNAFVSEGTACAAFRSLGLSEYGMEHYKRLKRILSEYGGMADTVVSNATDLENRGGSSPSAPTN